jgi:hypothetical protein
MHIIFWYSFVVCASVYILQLYMCEPMGALTYRGIFTQVVALLHDDADVARVQSLAAAWAKKVELVFALEAIASKRTLLWWDVVCCYGALLSQAEESGGALAAPLAAIRLCLAKRIGKEMQLVASRCSGEVEGGPLRLTRAVLDRCAQMRTTMCSAFAPYVFRETEDAAGWCNEINQAEQMDLLLDCRSIAGAIGDSSAADELWKKTAEILNKAMRDTARHT